jgi:hypothetical protein
MGEVMGRVPGDRTLSAAGGELSIACSYRRLFKRIRTYGAEVSCAETRCLS